MRSLSFWQSWTAGYRYTWYAGASVLLAALLYACCTYLQGPDAVIHWQKLQEQKAVNATVHSFQEGPFELSVPAESFVIFEYFNGSALMPNTTAAYVYLVLLALGAAMLLAIISTMDRFWFLGGMLFFILFVLSLRLRVLGLFGQINYLPAITMVVCIAGICAWFNIFRRTTPFLTRVVVLALLLCGVGLAIGLSAEVPYPFIHLAVTSFPGALVFTILFILLVAHEIPAAFITLISRAHTGGRSMQHFLIIYTIYLANLTITALHETGYIDWNFIYINPYLLLAIATVVGLWGFRARESQYVQIMPFHPLGAYFFVAFGSLAWAFTSWQLGCANDASLMVVRHVIIFSQLGFGIIFFTYIIANFSSMLAQGVPIHKVLYKPVNMPYFMFQFGGLIATLAFVFYVGWREYVHHGIAGFYNNLGDLDITLDNEPFALAHYKKAGSYGFENHHANYALGVLHTRPLSFKDAHYYYERANGQRPSAYSLVNGSNLYAWEHESFRAIASYRTAHQRMPGSGVINNNLGYTYEQIIKVDSAAYFLNEARGDDHTKPSAEANMLGLTAVAFIPVQADSLLDKFDTTYTITLANALALAASQQQHFRHAVTPFPDGPLDVRTATLLNNYLVHQITQLDTAVLQQAYRIAADSVNADFNESLKVTIAQGWYLHGDVQRALNIMAELAFISDAYKGLYNYLMGLWTLEQGHATRAAEYFKQAVATEYKEARLYHAIALTEAEQTDLAREAWNVLAESADPSIQTIAQQMQKILYARADTASHLTDPEKYQFCRYRLYINDTIPFNQLVTTFENDNYHAKALLEMAERQFEQGRYATASRYFAQIGPLKITDEVLFEELRHFELALLARQQRMNTLKERLQQNDLVFTQGQALEKLYYTTLVQMADGDTANLATNFAALARANPYFEEGIIAGANYYRTHDPESLKAYNTLAEAVLINNASTKLMTAYIAEAMRKGFDNYVADGLQQLDNIKAQWP